MPSGQERPSRFPRDIFLQLGKQFPAAWALLHREPDFVGLLLETKFFGFNSWEGYVAELHRLRQNGNLADYFDITSSMEKLEEEGSSGGDE